MTDVRFEVLRVQCRHCRKEIPVEVPSGATPGEAMRHCEEQAKAHSCPEMKKIYVVSTGLNAPTKARCFESVRVQEGVLFEHRYVEAGEQSPPKNVIENQAFAIRELPPEAVVVLLDGDDWLAHPHALARVRALHDAGAWVTWGAFECSDGRKGFAGPVDWDLPVRSQPWVATHLKTMRAGLFQRLRPEDLSWPEGAPVPWDMVAMFAALEMAGPERSTFCPDVLAVYNFSSSHEWTHGHAGRAEELAIEKVVRARIPYPRLEEL